ncbi:M20/M25/M40 family metallo-hydrolase [Adhaeribacter radiodurans]|uniref:Carboxypeptidase Q n=1 Tax=Adhaeribacter radiodurans TaxID=2745197 RepID=A0A7L7LAD4_9BACT|nr:M20/M25/M40 family metallo-hydrolase [Adhaeribacter radiodurans]QMU29796.1 M20/M25/M40 family metallo-hydrolase [Adhaeribacter radiodurans]
MRFKRTIFLMGALFVSLAGSAQISSDSVFIRKIFDEALTNSHSYKNLEYLSNSIGGRLSGSPEAEKAVQWSKKLMESYGFDKVYLQEVMVPHWVRGAKEKANIQSGKTKIEVPICALGGSVSTGTKPLTASIIEVKTLDELKNLGRSKVQGKIVFFNRPMDPRQVLTFIAYSGAGDQRRQGAVEAAKLGAVGVVVRSLNLFQDDFPHTGSLRYDEAVTKIPAAAISTNGADKLSKMLKTDPNLKFSYEMHCETLPDVKSYNVIGELRGSEKPTEIIAVGGHLDSWDLADGSHDDGTGCMQSIEVLRLFKSLNYQPKRTIRAVMFMNEENGTRGGRKYAELAKNNKENHLAAIESDAGGFTPRGFGMEADPAKIKAIQKWKPLLASYGLHDIGPGHSGTDIEPLREVDKNAALIGFLPDSQRYFLYHHAANDTFDKVNKRELELGEASMAALVYLLDKYGLDGSK